MIATLFNHYHYLRIGITFVLLLFIGFKTICPIVLLVKSVYKEISAATESDDNKVEKKAENDPSSERNYEYACFYSKAAGHIRSFVKIAHVTVYFNHYQASHHFEVSTPPPNFILRTTV